MSLESLFVITGCLLLSLLVIVRLLGGQRAAITSVAFAGLGLGLLALGLVHTWRRERPTDKAAEFASDGTVRSPVALQSARNVTAPEKTGVVGLSYFVGNWRNVKTPVRGLTKLRVRTQGESVWVHAWERCHPTDCDWGEAPGAAVTPENSSDARNDVQKVTATFQTSFTETTMTLTPTEENTLEAGTQTRFTDNSGRSSYSTTYTFRH